MLDPGRRVRREVRVLREDGVRRDELADLHEPATLADSCVQRIKRLDLLELGRTDDGLAERRHTEVDNALSEWSAAESAGSGAPKGFGRRLEMLQCRHVANHTPATVGHGR